MKADLDPRYLETALRAAREAGDITLKYFRGELNIDRKSDETPVTIADREAEKHLRSRLSSAFPDCGILGEEFGEENPGSEYRWIIDPIDGTKSFIHGVPLYGVLVALEYQGDSLLGVIHHPALKETVWAVKGGGCYCNGERVHVADMDPPCLSMSSAGMLWDLKPAEAKALLEKYPKARTWGDCYGYTLVATGRIQIMIDPIMSLWDLAALKPVIEEAGGVFTDWNGKAGIHIENSIGATPRFHEEVMGVIRGAR